MSSMAWMVLSWKPGKWNWVQRQEAISVEAFIGHKAIFPTYLFVLLHLIQTKNKWVDPQDTFLGEWFNEYNLSSFWDESVNISFCVAIKSYDEALWLSCGIVMDIIPQKRHLIFL